MRVKIRRAHLLEDGYVQLSGLRPEQLKGTIRIEFVNETGLAEAGIGPNPNPNPNPSPSPNPNPNPNPNPDQVKPQLEKLLKLPPTSLTKEVELTQARSKQVAVGGSRWQ